MVPLLLLQFLKDLRENNNREWFHDHKEYYEEYKTAYALLIQEFLDAMVPHDASLRHLEVKDCSFRIARDIRFSKDKTPYKTHAGIWLSGGPKKVNMPGYYVHLEPGKSFLGGGLWWPESHDLKKIRKEVAYFHEDLEEILNEDAFRKEFGTLERTATNALKISPKEYDKDHPAISHLQLKSFTAGQSVDDSLLRDTDFVEKVAAKLLLLKPLNAFLTRGLLTEN